MRANSRKASSVPALLRQEDTCWAASSGRGSDAAGIYNVKCDRNDWRLVSTLPMFELVMDMTGWLAERLLRKQQWVDNQ